MDFDEIPDDEVYNFSGLQLLGKDLKNPEIRRILSDSARSRKESAEYVRRCYPDAYDTQVYQGSYDPIIYTIYSGFDGIKPLVRELGLPDEPEDYYCSFIYSAARFFKRKRNYNKRLDNYSVEEFGLCIRRPKVDLDAEEISIHLEDIPLPDPAQYKCPPRYWRLLSGSCLLQVWRLRVFACPVESLRTSPSSPLALPDPVTTYLEQRWHPRKEIRRIRAEVNQERGAQAQDTKLFFKDALIILGNTEKKGRPPGPTEYKDPDAFANAYRTTAFSLASQSKRRPRQEDIARVMGISRGTLNARRKDFGVPRLPR